MKLNCKIVLILLLGIVNQNSFSQGKDSLFIFNNKDVHEGRLIWNLTEFEGLYGIPDSLINVYKNTILSNIKGRENEKEIKDFTNDYKYLEENKLLYSPCRFVVINEKIKIRVFFLEEDNERIHESDWFNKNKKEKLQTYLKMRIRWIKDKTYFCEDLIEINQRVFE